MTAATQNISRQHGADPWMDSFLPALRAAGTMTLELGCGPGEDAAALAAHGFRVVGFDLVPKAVRKAVANAPDAHFLVADLQSPLPIRSAAVASTVASLSLHYFPWRGTAAIVDEVRRVLRPGGVFLFRVNATDDTEFGAGAGEELEPHYYRVPPDGRNNRPFKRFFDAAMVRAMLAPGWRIDHLAHRTINRYDTPKQVWECCAHRQDEQSRT